MNLLRHVFMTLISAALCISGELVQAGDLVATTFAGNDLLQNATAVSVDLDGTVYAVQTDRRKGGEWSEGPRELSFGFSTLAEKRAWLEANPLARIQGPRDNNKDGQVNAGDLTTNAEVIHRLRDTTGDGKADHHEIFSNAFKDKMDGVGGGILARKGEVWFTCFPTLWKLNEKAERKPLVTGFAVKIGQRGHDLHGLRIGPYGRLYWTLATAACTWSRMERPFLIPIMARWSDPNPMDRILKSSPRVVATLWKSPLITSETGLPRIMTATCGARKSDWFFTSKAPITDGGGTGSFNDDTVRG